MGDNSSNDIIEFFKQKYLNNDDIYVDKVMLNNIKSSSDSTFYTAVNKNTGQDVFIKSFYIPSYRERDSDKNNWEGTLYEAYIYHFIKAVCDEYESFSSHFVILDSISLTNYNESRGSGKITIATEFAKGDKSFKEILRELLHKSDSQSIKLVKCILFDFMYGIYLLNEKLGVIHNDLHFNNARFIVTDEPYEETYDIGGIKFKMAKSYKIKIYDFDHSTIYGSKKNGYIEGFFCNEYGSCNFKTKKDIFTTFTNILSLKRSEANYIMSELLGDISRIIIKNNYLYNEISKFYRFELGWTLFCNIPFEWEKNRCPSDQLGQVKLDEILKEYADTYSDIFLN